MKGDFTRSTFDHKKHYSGVRMQQGRVQLDADWNEQVDIQTYLLEQSLKDVVGPCGAPLQYAGFALSVDDGKLMIGEGHYYVNGTLCENENECNYLKQENIKDAKLPKADGNYLFYLDVWQKHVTAVEDKSISEIALGGPDTTTRTKTIWQVKYIPIPDALDKNPCIQNFDEWDDLIAKREPKLKASVHHETDSTNPCIVLSRGGYRGLENHLYRVEIHRVDNGKTTFKWSRDNGSIFRAVGTIDGNVIKIKNAGPDILHAFEPDQWIEITDEKRELNEEPGTLVHLTEVKDGAELKFDPDDPDAIIGDPVSSTNYPKEHNPKVRRWDQTKSGEITIDSKWIELEHGLGVEFEKDGNYKSGDFWLIPARTADGDIKWSLENGGWHQPFGIEHQYCPLAIVNYEDREWEWEIVKDCRRIFPNMTEMVTLSYAGGDGQEAMPGNVLPAPLQVRVSVGQHPIMDARVQFSIIEGKGNLQLGTKPAVTTLTMITGYDGIAGISLLLDKEYNEDESSVRVEASLLDAMLLNDEEESLGDHPLYLFSWNDVPGNDNVKLKEYLKKIFGAGWVESAKIEKSDDKMTINLTSEFNCISLELNEEETKISLEINDVRTVELNARTENSKLNIYHPSIHPSIHFQANLSIAKNVYYDPEFCHDLDKKGIDTVQDAIDELCKYRETEKPVIHIEEIYIKSADLDQLLANDSEISVDDLAGGIKVVCNNEIDPKTIEGKPTCFVTLDLPYPFNSADMKLWGSDVIGFQPLILAADLISDVDVIYWNPTENTKSWLESDLFRNMSKLQRGDRILAHLTLKGNFIRTKEDPYLYLDGEAYGVPGGENETNLTLPSGNGRRGGDFEMWFWLVEGGGIKYVEYDIPEDLLVENGLCDDGEKNCKTQGEISGGRFYAMVGSHVALNGNPDALVDLLVNEGVGNGHSLSEGESFSLTEGITLTAEKIDIEKEYVKFSLTKNGEEISNKLVYVGELYTHVERDIMEEPDVPVFVTFVEDVFAGTNTNMVEITSTWLISMDK